MKKYWPSAAFIVLSLLIGLFPFVLSIGVAIADENSTFDWEKFFREFGIGFFCSATVSGIALEYLFENQATDRLRFVFFAYILYPGAIMTIAVLVYVVILLGKPWDAFIQYLQIAMLAMSLLYLFLTKAIKFSK